MLLLIRYLLTNYLCAIPKAALINSISLCATFMQAFNDSSKF